MEQPLSLSYCLYGVTASEGEILLLVGRYEILEIIGTGAHGRVARAHDPLIGRLVAIKLFPIELARGEARQRFLQEARVVGQLSHPSIITLHDMGIEESTQTPYLVMEFLEGQTLDRILDKGTVPLPKACAWAAEVASALSVAHRKGVIHGDVKPANMLITDDGRVKLMDFFSRWAWFSMKWSPASAPSTPILFRASVAVFFLRSRSRRLMRTDPCRRLLTKSSPGASQKILRCVIPVPTPSQASSTRSPAASLLRKSRR